MPIAIREVRTTNHHYCLGQGFPVGHRAVGLVALPGGADGGVEVGPGLRLVLGFVQVADGADCKWAGRWRWAEGA